ncbi:uncharacterized protein LOC101239711 isoform X1 [Hydra vulgaris]|uniref:uncharacterized protein LOC101239711 isoform X1 n=1 Tax=Hydra vulgaris TaxID=6087 RepID=UPI001F5E47C7|nr:uncharacterized protein LOC101239711 [Hydra vulgaris]
MANKIVREDQIDHVSYQRLYASPYFQRENYERIQKWLNEQPDFILYPPSEDDSVSSSIYSNYKMNNETASKYETNNKKILKHSYEDELSNNFQNTKIFSPNTMRRRRYIPYSYPTLTQSQSLSCVNELGLPDQPDTRLHPRNCSVLNKGNTFPRRNHISNKQSSNIFQQAQVRKNRRTLHDDLYKNTVIQGHQTKLNHHIDSKEVLSRKNSSKPVFQPIPLDSANSNAYINSSNFTTGDHSYKVKTLADNSQLKDITTIKSEHLSHNQSSEIPLKEPPKFDRKTDNDQNENKVLTSSFDNIEFLENPSPLFDFPKSPELHLVKAYSWPKRPVYFRNENYLFKNEESTPKKILNKTEESGYNTEKSEEKWDSQSAKKISSPINDTFASESSLCSDIPPERPPLPYNKETVTWLKLPHDTKTDLDTSMSLNQLSVPHVVPVIKGSDQTIEIRNLKDLLIKNEVDQIIHKKSESAESPNRSTITDLQNRSTDLQSISLRDLIKLHEEKIASVSARSTYKGGLKRFSPVLMRDVSSENKAKNSWKRHTTIGCNGFEKYNVENFQPIENGEGYLAFSSSEHLNKPVEKVVTNSISNYSRSDSIAYLKSMSGSLVLSKIVDSSVLVSREQQYQNLISLPFASDRLDSQQKLRSTLTKDAFSQTTSVSHSTQSHLDTVKELNLELENLKLKHKYECDDLIRKLEEQKKVANAYQKLEDRYRRKVFDLQKMMKSCTCTRRSAKDYLFENGCNSLINRQTVLEDNHDISVQKVDGILNQLEAWLNHEQTEEYSDEILSFCMNESVTKSNRYINHTLDIIDKFDATSV